MSDIDKTARIYKYMCIARNQALVSKATDHKVGAILVRNNTVISTGYNGLPRGIREHNDPRYKTPNWNIFPDEIIDNLTNIASKSLYTASAKKQTDPRRLLGYDSGEATHLVMHVHAELNAILNAARAGVSTVDADMYCYCGIPCSKCMMAIINAGIKSVTCLLRKSSLPDNEYLQKSSLKLAAEAGIPIIEVPIEEIEKYESELVENVLR